VSAAAPSSCDVAAAAIRAATIAEGEGRLLRAERGLASAGAICPALRADAEAARARVVAALDDARGDSAGIEASVNEVDDYAAAARAFLDMRLDEAEKRGLAVALAKGRLAVEAQILAARLAEHRHDPARARRWFARALRGAAAAAKPEAPRPDGFAWTASIAGFHPWPPSCMSRSVGDAHPVALTPDATVALFGAPDGVVLRAVPSRVLVADIALPDGAFVCFSDAARASVAYEGGLEVRLARSAGAAQTIKLPDPLGVEPFGFVGTDGAAFLPRYLDNDRTAEWYRAAPGDRIAHKIALPVGRGAIVPLLARGNSLLAFEGKADETMLLARFDPRTGKKIEPIARVSTGGTYAESSDGSRLVYTTGEDLFVVDFAAKSGKKLAREPFGRLVGLVGSAQVVEEDRTQAIAQDLTTGARSWTGVIDRFEKFDRSGRRLLALLPEDILALDLASGSVVRYAIPAPVSEPHASNRRTHAALSDDGAFLISGIGDTTTIFDVHDPARPTVITTFAGRLLEASFAPASSVVRLLVDGPTGRRAYDAAQRKEASFAEGIIAPPPIPRERIAALGTLDPGASICAFDEATGTIAVCPRDNLAPPAIAIARPINGRFESVRLTFAYGRAGGIAIDEQGYYDLFGDVPASFRASATCGRERPIDVCADRFETPGLAQKLLRGNLSYRAP
jgi:hypothetical protein